MRIRNVLAVIAISMLPAVQCFSIDHDGPETGPPPTIVLPAGSSDEQIKDFYETNHADLFVVGKRVWVKAIITPTLAQAQKAKQRAEAGEDFDELIAEYFVPYFATHPERQFNKGVDFGWVDPARFWRSDKAAGPILGLDVGSIAGPHPLYGKGPEFVILKIVAERAGATAQLDEVADNIYSRLWDELADPKILKEVDLGKSFGCGTCRAGHDVGGQLWRLAQQASEQGDERKAVAACLLALREDRRMSWRGGPKANENGLYPEEQFLVDHGMDITRYYGGTIDRVVRDQPVRLPDWLPSRIAQIKDARVVPMLIRLVANRGRWSGVTMYALGNIKARSAVPILKELLTDRRIKIVERQGGGRESVYAYYYLRARARDALRSMGIETGKVKTLVGAVQGDPVPQGRL